MRHRKVQNLDKRMEAAAGWLVEDAAAQRGTWREYFAGLSSQDGLAAAADPAKRLYMELGCGKGKFLTARACADPDAFFIGIEGLDAVLIRGLERAKELDICNLRFVMTYVADIRDYFADGELDGIYLNFSDPWPKPRHTKRRFTYGETLLRYKQILKPGGFVAFKTDNEDLFAFTLDEIARLGLTVTELSRDLHSPDCTYPAKDFTTEYEDKFSGKGKNINYVKVVF